MSGRSRRLQLTSFTFIGRPSAQRLYGIGPKAGGGMCSVGKVGTAVVEVWSGRQAVGDLALSGVWVSFVLSAGFGMLS